eukprot:CAMPEP_0206223420 /NCGR_PEP_ID=MMETSP0047_2-20121206/6477_1 /ASSEMBLY_ACC=CAM_ASM_000192 /TAXON_ID=195065 /ORGANISM="Chroomonas mesostigmatica_cf, Strain CCMP1168" /LENGTH=166 /DNA_ID=CAMNT_0053646297 /DNA_START=230 /DNA_END=731 /DNA_ORIENTATION=-
MGWKSGGMLQIHASEKVPQFRKWDEIKEDDNLLVSVKWATLKRPDRAIEKIVRSYSQDTSRLLDVCRQSIYFETLEALYTCVRTIRKDPDARPCRVKNRYDTSFDSGMLAGYRDFAINMRIVTKDTIECEVDTHVCEVLLLHKEFAQLKHDEGHKRYIQFRNARGE